MNAGVEIILERIKTNPEEFCTKGGGKIANGKWSRVLDNYSQHLDKEDYDAIKNAIDKVQQDYFTEEVMTILVDGRDKVLEDKEVSLYANVSNLTHSGGVISTTSPTRVRLISPDGLITKVVTVGSQSFIDLLSQGYTDPRRMRTGVPSYPTTTIPPTI